MEVPGVQAQNPPHSPLLAKMPTEQRARVGKLAARSMEIITQWGNRHPIIRVGRAPATALTLSAAAPSCTDEEIALLGRLCMWIFAVDDLFDEGLPNIANPEQHLIPVLGLLDSDATYSGGSADPFYRAFAELCSDLSQYRLFPAFRVLLQESVALLFSSMAKESAWRDQYQRSNGQCLPTYDAYTENGASSIGMRTLYRAMALMLGEPATPQHWPLLRQMEQEAALSVRLANDLRTYQRELREQNINSLTILASPPGGRGAPTAVALGLARIEVQARMEQALDRCASLCQRDPEASALLKQVYLSKAHSSCAFYLEHDFDAKLSLGSGPI